MRLNATCLWVWTLARLATTPTAQPASKRSVLMVDLTNRERRQNQNLPTVGHSFSEFSGHSARSRLGGRGRACPIYFGFQFYVSSWYFSTYDSFFFKEIRSQHEQSVNANSGHRSQANHGLQNMVNRCLIDAVVRQKSEVFVVSVVVSVLSVWGVLCCFESPSFP